MKRRSMRERDEAAGREQAEHRLEDLLARLKDREAAARATPVPKAPPEAPEPETAGSGSADDQEDGAAS